MMVTFIFFCLSSSALILRREALAPDPTAKLSLRSLNIILVITCLDYDLCVTSSVHSSASGRRSLLPV